MTSDAYQPATSNSGLDLKPTRFDELNGWSSEAVAGAFLPFLLSCRHRHTSGSAVRPGAPPPAALATVCGQAQELGNTPAPDDVMAFFMANFRPYDVVAPISTLTAYYEPVVAAARTADSRFRYPLYRWPLDSEGDNGVRAPNAATDPIRPILPERALIDNGALADRGLELIYLEDPVDVYFVHIQGSTRARLRDGSLLRIGFAGKNGHPYRSVGRALLDDGVIAPDRATAEDVKAWMRAHPDEARRYMHKNPSYVFFREIDNLDPALGPIGGEGVPLTPGRSLAIDAGVHAYGLPLWLEADLPTGSGGAMRRFERLMITQDTGAAIKGPARGDIFWGTGAEAGEIAGRVNNPGRFVVFLPCDES